MPHISQNPVVRQIFDEFSEDTQYWVNQHLSPESLDVCVRGKANILIQMHPELKPTEVQYLTDCFNTVYTAAKQRNIYILRPVVSVLNLIKSKTTRDHSTQTD